MEIFRPAYGEKAAAGVSVRTMNYLCFLNTKTLFKYMRYDAALGAASYRMYLKSVFVLRKQR